MLNVLTRINEEFYAEKLYSVLLILSYEEAFL